MIRFRSLGSGSGGNATVVEASSGITTTRLLIDAGDVRRDGAAATAEPDGSYLLGSGTYVFTADAP